jgi:hypothetical protein
MAGVMLLVSLLQSRFDYHAILKVIAVYWAYFGWRMARMLKVDSSPYMISEMFSILVMCGMITAIGFFNAPIITFPITMMAFCVVGFFTANLRPGTVGYTKCRAVICPRCTSQGNNSRRSPSCLAGRNS